MFNFIKFLLGEFDHVAFFSHSSSQSSIWSILRPFRSPYSNCLFCHQSTQVENTDNPHHHMSELIPSIKMTFNLWLTVIDVIFAFRVVLCIKGFITVRSQWYILTSSSGLARRKHSVFFLFFYVQFNRLGTTCNHQSQPVAENWMPRCLGSYTTAQSVCYLRS